MPTTPIFRKSVIDKMSSPEQLTDYIKVNSPSVWVTLLSVFILLLCFFVWCVYGRVEVTSTDHNGQAKTEIIRPIDYFM